MHSFRAVLSAAGDETPPFSLRELTDLLDVRPPLTMRRAIARLTFPENEVELFKPYDVGSEFLSAMVAALPSKKLQLPDFDQNKEARQLLEDKFALRAMLEPLGKHADEVHKKTAEIYNGIVRREPRVSEGLIDQLPEATIPLVGPDETAWDNALRRDDVEGVTLGPQGPQKVTIPGYKGKDVDRATRQKIVDTALFLRLNTAERRFRTNLMTAESLASQRQFDAALARYDEMLGGGGMSQAERKFVSLRKAAAQNAAADRAFNALEPDDSEGREAVRAKYLATGAILQAAGVNTENPVLQALLAHAEVQLFLVANGFNALGSGLVLRPEIRKSADVLRNEAEQLRQQAGDAIQLFKSFTETLESVSDSEIRVQMDISAASSALRELDIEQDILNAERRRLDTQNDFLRGMLAVEVVSTTIGAIIAMSAGTGGSDITTVGGNVSNGANAAGRLIDLARQIALVGVDQDILDLQFEALAARGREARRHHTFLEVLGTSTTVRLEKYLELANRFEELTVEALRGAMRKAFQAEVRLAFERGTAERLRIIRTGILNYESDQDLFVLSQGVQEQLNALSSAINEGIQATDLRRQVTLSQLDPLALLRLQQTGETEFAVSLYDVDRMFPGNPNVRIKDVALVFPSAALPSADLTVNLTHRGVFLVRDPDTLLDATAMVPEVAEVEQAGAAFLDGRSVTVGGVTFINAAENARTFVLPMPVPEKFEGRTTRQGLEGYGLTGVWNLEINKNQLDDVNLANLTDVDLFFYVEAGEAREGFRDHVNALIATYEQQQEEEQGDVLDRITSFGMRDKFRDALDDIVDTNPPEGVVIDVTSIFGEAAETFLKAVILQVVQNGQGLPGIGLKISKDDPPILFDRSTQAGGFTENLEGDIPIIEKGKRFPVGGAWTLRVVAPDTQGIDDIKWFFVHEARTRTQPVD